MIAFTSAVEPLRMANRLSGEPLYEWITITENGEPVPASSGLAVQPDCSIDEAADLDILFICGGLNIGDSCSKSIVSWLQKLARQKVGLGALCTGTYVLARSDLLNGTRCTVHWENLAAMREEFPQLNLSHELFEICDNRYTCAGGTASLDMMLNLIGQQHSIELAAEISEEFMCERIRDHNDLQRIPLRQYLGTSQPKLMEAVSLMEANLEEPMSLDELSQYVCLSRRQLERLFRKHLHCVPTRYYLNLRLARARQLLLQTNMTVVDVTLACGFVSAPHFSKCYRDHFGIPPSEERRPQKFLRKNEARKLNGVAELATQ
ncbi:MAG: GlxA family transcriptional regulator [Gammaproteobacteria bacterium]